MSPSAGPADMGQAPDRAWSRRRLLRAAGALGLGTMGAGLLAACGEADGPLRQNRVAFLSGNVLPESPERDAFVQGLRTQGYVEGRNLTLQWFFTERDAQLPERAAVVVRQRPDVIVTAGTPATQAAKNATSSIPVVGAATGDPVGTGLVVSLAHPGGNVTGVRSSIQGLNAKRLELLKEAFPQMRRVGIVGNPTNPVVALQFVELEEAAPSLQVAVERLEVRTADDFTTVFAAATRALPDGLVVLFDGLTQSNRERIVEFAASSRLPAIYAIRDFVDAGGLMTYSPSFPDMYKRAAHYVDKILRGARPADLPVERPRQFNLVINMDAARALGVTIPLSVRVQTDEVIGAL